MASMEPIGPNRMVCERCFKQNKLDVFASGYCSTCAKYFCSSCLHVHRNLLPSHTIEEVPEHFTMKRCKVHDSEFLKFYCEQHDSFICNLCTREDEHLLCRSLETISFLTMNMKSNEHYQTFQDELSMLLKNTENLKREYEKKIEFLNQQNNEANSDSIKKADSYDASRMVKESNDFLVIDNFDSVLMVKKELQNINEIERTAQQTLFKIADFPYESKAETCDTFMRLKVASSTIKQCSRKLNAIPQPPQINVCRKDKRQVLLSAKDVFERYVFEVTRDTEIMLQNNQMKFIVLLICAVVAVSFVVSLGLFCKIAYTNCLVGFSRTHDCELCQAANQFGCSWMTKYTDAINKYELNLRLQTSRFVGARFIVQRKTSLYLIFKGRIRRQIRGISVICGDRLLVTDVELFNFIVSMNEKETPSFYFEETRGPVGLVGTVGPNTYFVELPETKDIKYFSCLNRQPTEIKPTKQLRLLDRVLRKYIVNDDNVKHVLVHNDLCIIATRNEVYTVAIDNEDRTIIYSSKIKDNDIGIAFGKWNSFIYVADYGMNVILKLTLDGEIIAATKESWSVMHNGNIVVGKSGSVYVCGHLDIYAISPDLKDIQRVHGVPSPFLVNCGDTMALLEQDGSAKLYIAYKGSSDVDVFDL